MPTETPPTEPDAKFAYPPLPWIGARFKFDVRDMDGNKVLTKTLDNVFFERWIRPGMHLSSIKRPEIEMKALERADRIFLHSHDASPIHVTTRELAFAEKDEERRGWSTVVDLDFQKLPTLPELIAGQAEGRKSAQEVTCFMNNIGLGYQFAAAGSVVYRKAKASGLGHELPTDWFTEDVHP